MQENDTNQLALAPAAGSGLVSRIMGELLKDEERFVGECVQAAHDGLTAMTPRRWDKELSDWVSDPDARVRVQTLFGLFAQSDGEPIKRVVHEIRKTVDPQDVLSTPAAIEAAERMVAGARAKMRRAGVKGVKRAEPIEAEAADAAPGAF